MFRILTILTTTEEAAMHPVRWEALFILLEVLYQLECIIHIITEKDQRLQHRARLEEFLEHSHARSASTSFVHNTSVGMQSAGGSIPWMIERKDTKR